MLERKQYNKIKKGHIYLPLDINTNSVIYKNRLELIKFPFKEIIISNDLEQILQYIDEKDIDCCVKPNTLIYKENEFMGYKIKFYRDYKSLRKLLNKDFTLKKQYCKNIEGTFNILTENNLEIFDYNLSNILLNQEGNVLICDLDGLKITDGSDLDRKNRKNLFVLALAYLYKFQINEVEALLKHRSTFLIQNNDELIQLFNRINNNEKVNIENLLEIINEDDVKQKRKHLKYDLDFLKDSGYFRKYF